MTARIDASGINPRRASPIAQAQQHLKALNEILAGGPLPLAPEQADFLHAQVQEALEAVVVACRLADWLERQAGHGATTDQDGQSSAAFGSFFGALGAGRTAPAPEREDEDLAVVRQRIAQIDDTARVLASVLGDSRGPVLAAVALRDGQQAEAIVGVVTQAVGQLGSRAAELCGGVGNPLREGC